MSGSLPRYLWGWAGDYDDMACMELLDVREEGGRKSYRGKAR